MDKMVEQYKNFKGQLEAANTHKQEQAALGKMERLTQRAERQGVLKEFLYAIGVDVTAR